MVAGGKIVHPLDGGDCLAVTDAVKDAHGQTEARTFTPGNLGGRIGRPVHGDEQLDYGKARGVLERGGHRGQHRR